METITTSSCSSISLAAGEDLFGTASRAESYLLLEYNDAWHKKAFEQSTLSAAVKEHLSIAQAALPKAKIMLIKSQQGLRTPGVSFFVVDARQGNEAAWEFRLENFEDLPGVNIQGLFMEREAGGAVRRIEPLYLVCTNGKRDPCCARFGLAVYSELLALAPGQVWQSSHHGGHRFAANLLSLPHGIEYGRLSPENVAEVVAADRRGEVFLPAFRGRTAYSAPAQAGEYFLRGETGRLGIDDFLPLGTREIGPAEWEVRFRLAGSGQTYRLRLRREPVSGQIIESCGQETYSPLERWKLVEVNEEEAESANLHE